MNLFLTLLIIAIMSVIIGYFGVFLEGGLKKLKETTSEKK